MLACGAGPVMATRMTCGACGVQAAHASIGVRERTGVLQLGAAGIPG